MISLLGIMRTINVIKEIAALFLDKDNTMFNGSSDVVEKFDLKNELYKLQIISALNKVKVITLALKSLIITIIYCVLFF